MRSAIRKINNWWLAYEYKHTTLAIIIIVLFVVLVDTTLLATAVRALDGSGYFGAIIAGAFSVSFFTAAPSVTIMVGLAPHFNPITLSLLIAVGGLIGDWLLLRFFEEKIFAELMPIFRKLHLHKARRWLERPFTKWLLILTGAAVISSPLPDEAGLALMGIAHYNRFVLLAICFVLNAFGAFVFVSAVRALM